MKKFFRDCKTAPTTVDNPKSKGLNSMTRVIFIVRVSFSSLNPGAIKGTRRGARIIKIMVKKIKKIPKVLMALFTNRQASSFLFFKKLRLNNLLKIGIKPAEKAP